MLQQWQSLVKIHSVGKQTLQGIVIKGAVQPLGFLATNRVTHSQAGPTHRPLAGGSRDSLPTTILRLSSPAF